MKINKNILILEAGGPCAISCLKIIRKQHPEVRIVAADMSSTAPGLQMADIKVTIPAVSETAFVDSIKSIIDKYKIDLVVPCFEFGFDKLSKIDGPFVTDFESAIRCKDKYLFYHYCLKKNVPHPQTWLLNEAGNEKFPLYIKPRSGVGSRNNYTVFNQTEFERLKKYLEILPEEYIVQEQLSGKHWNVDVLVDNGVVIMVVPRMDLLQKSGNCITVKVEKYNALIEFTKNIQSKLNIKSPFNLEVFEVSPKKFVINEINVRFGGGIIFSALAGADFVSYLIDPNTKPLRFHEGIFSRYYEEINIDFRAIINL